jgi:hypothetical protein
MPGQFINNSNSGGVTFKNNSNSGQAIFSLGTPAPTPPPVVTLYVDLNSGVACSGLSAYELPTYAYTGTQTLCGCTSLNAANAVDLSAGTYYVSDQTNTRQFISPGGGSTLLTASGVCTAC